MDLLVGGSPCQSFSTVGFKGGLEDARGTLFYEYARIVKEVNPTISLIEESKLRNVKKCLLITPYNDQLGKEIAKMLEDNEIQVIKNINLDLLHTADYFNYGINKLEKLIKENYLNEYENIIISCTNLPTIGVIENLEYKFNTQIISSNSSLFAKIKRDNNI